MSGITKLSESLVDHIAVSKRLKTLGMNEKQGHRVPYELKPRNVKCFFDVEFKCSQKDREK